MPLATNLRHMPLLDILRTVASEQRDGCLTLTYGHYRAEIYFRRGQWLTAERIPVGPPLTEQFVDLGFMTPEQIEEVILVPFDEAAVLPDGQIVQALMADGRLTREQLQYWAMSDALGLVTAIAAWPEGEVSFVDGIHPPQELALAQLSVENILTSFGQGSQPPTARHSGQGATGIPLRQDTVLTFTDIPDSGQVVELSREEWMVLAQIDGANPLGVIADTLRMDAHTLVEIAHGLLSRGLLEPAATTTTPYT
jgi:hypothetical protein